MEFFKIINLQTTEALIQKNVHFENLDDLCANMFVMSFKDNIANIGGIWGEFSLQKDLINGGLRFSFLECPNALAFTLTTGFLPEPDKIVLHLTVNRLELKSEFVEEIEEFMTDWKTGMENNFKLQTQY
ncbi:MAG: hypothetical protein OEM04_04600 [Flavobacteriaceae bacterium]|nr:hypothetical protein [Flavobacteriaceae bacterium]